MNSENEKGAAGSTASRISFPEEEEKIRVALSQMQSAWARGDAAAYAACFTDDSDYVTFNGIHLVGRQENEALHSALFRGALRGTRVDAAIVSVALLSDSVALVHTANGRKKSLQTFVFVKVEGKWLIRSFQNTRQKQFSIRFTRWLQRRASR